MKLILGKPIVVGQGPTLEEADWGPWQFPQLLKREDGTLFASVNRTTGRQTAIHSGSSHRTAVEPGRKAPRQKPRQHIRKQKTVTALRQRTEAP